MFTRKTFFAAAVLGAMGAGLAALPAVAQPGPGSHGPDSHGPGHGGWHHRGPLLEGVTLTSEQKTKLHALMRSQHEDKGLFMQMRDIHKKIDDAIFSTGTVSEASLQPLLQQEAMVMQQIEAKHLATELAIRNLLTPDQLAQAASTHAKLIALHEQEHALMRGGDEPPPDHGN